MRKTKRIKRKLNIKHNNHDINIKTFYFPHCKDSRQFAKLMKVKGFWSEDLHEIKKLGYNFDLFIKQDNKGYSQTIDFLGD